MSDIHSWARYPDMILDVREEADEDELKAALAWALAEEDDLADELATKIINVFIQPGDRAAARSLSHGIELVLDAYFAHQEGS